VKDGNEPIRWSDESDESSEQDANEPHHHKNESNKNNQNSDEESSDEEDPQTANMPFKNETSEERLVRMDISRMILNGASIEKIKWMYPNYYSKQKTLIGLAHMFHANHASSDHPFFCGMIHTKAVLVEDYDPLSENDLIRKIVNILLFSDKSLEYIKNRFPEYFNSHKEHIALYRNYCSAKKTFDVKFRTRMNTYDSIISFSPFELEQLLSGYEERLKKERENNKQKRRYNFDLTLEETADLIEQKKQEDLYAVIHTIKNNFSNNEFGVKKFKRNTSDDDEEEDEEKDNRNIVTVKQKVEECIQRYGLQRNGGIDAIPKNFTHSDLQPYNGTDTVPENFIQRYSLQSYNGTDDVPEDFVHSDFEFDDCTADDFAPQDLVAPQAPVFNYTTDDPFPEYLEPPALPRVKTKQSANRPDQKH
jgi:hypothetical protein